jgi:hypothetical protein
MREVATTVSFTFFVLFAAIVVSSMQKEEIKPIDLSCIELSDKEIINNTSRIDIKGRIRNNCQVPLLYVQVSAALYDSKGIMLDTVSDTEIDINVGAAKEFIIFHSGDASKYKKK